MDLNAWTEAQRSVIGSLLLDPEQTAGEIFQEARPEFFGDPALRHVYEAALALWSEAKPIDPVTLLARAGDDYQKLLAECMRMTPTAVNVEAWIAICRDAAKLTAMQAEAMAIINARTADEAAAACERMNGALSGMEDIEILSMSEMISQYLDRMNDKTPVRYLNWGIDKLNDVLWVSPGQFGVIAADSSVGKTALSLQFAWHLAETGQRVGFFSLETPMESLEDRLMAETQVAGIPLPLTKKRQLTEDDYRRAVSAGIRSDKVPMKIVRKADSLERIRAVTLRQHFDVIFVDYVQLIDAPGRERWDIVTNISMGLHRMAQQLGITVIGLSQITPAAKLTKAAPTKDDLRESRQLKQDADFILILSLSADEKDVPGTRVLDIAKNKDGRCLKMKLSFDAEHMTFSYQPPDSPEMDKIRAQGRAKKNAKAPPRADTPDQAKLEKIEDDGDLPF